MYTWIRPTIRNSPAHLDFACSLPGRAFPAPAFRECTARVLRVQVPVLGRFILTGRPRDGYHGWPETNLGERPFTAQ